MFEFEYGFHRPAERDELRHKARLTGQRRRLNPVESFFDEQQQSAAGDRHNDGGDNDPGPLVGDPKQFERLDCHVEHQSLLAEAGQVSGSVRSMMLA